MIDVTTAARALLSPEKEDPSVELFFSSSSSTFSIAGSVFTTSVRSLFDFICTLFKTIFLLYLNQLSDQG